LLHLLLDLIALDVYVRAVGLGAPDEDRAGSGVDGAGVHRHAASWLRPNSALVRERLPLRVEKTRLEFSAFDASQKNRTCIGFVMIC
jgi:hypothetical protein